MEHVFIGAAVVLVIVAICVPAGIVIAFLAEKLGRYLYEKF